MWLSDSPRVLIGAGAGLSVAAGIDYGDVEDFARRFPALVRRGLTARYQLIGYAGLEDRAFWGYWAAHVADVRFSDRLSAVYTQLRELVAEKDYFVLTSNVDAMFARHGFDSERVCSIQGDYAYLQCVGPCTNEVWPTRPVDRQNPAHHRSGLAGSHRSSSHPQLSALWRTGVHERASGELVSRDAIPGLPERPAIVAERISRLYLSWCSISARASIRRPSCGGQWSVLPRSTRTRGWCGSTWRTQMCLALWPSERSALAPGRQKRSRRFEP